MPQTIPDNPYEIIDLTPPLQPHLVRWPGDEPLQLIQTRTLAGGDSCNASVLTISVHAGAHVDAPCHFMKDGAGVDELPLEILTGPARVADVGRAARLTPEVLETLRLPPDCIRLLLRTTNSAWWARGDTTFHSDFCAFSEEGAQWIVEQGIALVGVDYLSVQPWKAERRVHQILLQAGVIVVEGLNLDQAAPGDWELFCLPLRLTGADGAPARVMLRRPRAA